MKETENVCPLDFREDGSFVCRRSKGDRLLLATVGRQGHKDRVSLPGMCGVEQDLMWKQIQVADLRRCPRIEKLLVRCSGRNRSGKATCQGREAGAGESGQGSRGLRGKGHFVLQFSVHGAAEMLGG